jgi:outer membrane protein OmpA-like peptidoglycan-associated protein
VNPQAIVAAIAAFFLAIPFGLTTAWVKGAEDELERIEAEKAAAPLDAPQVAIAQAADVGYCTQDLKKILRRVLQSCGLSGAAQGRGCQPMEAKTVASLAGSDFNALFLPLAERAGIIQFDKESADLDAPDQQLLERIFADQKGASWFFVVSRASPEGSETYNRDLSQRRGEAVLAHLRTKFQDPELDKQVGLLWLGEEFAQLEQSFCGWQRSGDTATCTDQELNRSAFIAWIDCRL